MSKLETARKIFEIGKLGAEIYNTIADAKKKAREMDEKDKRIAELEAENKRLQEGK